MNILFSHVGLVLLVIGYAAGGAKIFMWLEQEREELAVSYVLIFLLYWVVKSVEEIKGGKGIEFLPQTQIFLSLYLCNQMVYTDDISNLDYIDLTEFIVWNIKGLRHGVAKI